MAWTTPLTAVANVALTAAQWNASVRDNLNETAPALATTVGRTFVVDATNSLLEVSNNGSTYTGGGTDTTNSNTYTTLTGGPALTITTTTKASILQTCRCGMDTAGSRCFYSHAVSGASTIAANDNTAVMMDAHSVARQITMAALALQSSLTAGSNTFTANFRTVSNIGTWSWRQLYCYNF